MITTTETSKGRRWPWVALIMGTLLAVALSWGVWSGSCVDVPEESDATSFCASGPAVGWPGAWIILAAGLILVAYAITRLVRARRR